MVSWLSGERAGYVTGCTLSLNGGQYSGRLSRFVAQNPPRLPRNAFRHEFKGQARDGGIAASGRRWRSPPACPARARACAPVRRDLRPGPDPRQRPGRAEPRVRERRPAQPRPAAERAATRRKSASGSSSTGRGARPLFRFERREETWVLRSTPAPRGDVIYRNDAGDQILRVTPDGGMTLYTARAPERLTRLARRGRPGAGAADPGPRPPVHPDGPAQQPGEPGARPIWSSST